MAAVASWEPRIGRTRACRAFGISDRTWRHHCQGERGDARKRHSRATHGPPKPHPAQLTPDEKDAVVAELCSPRFCDVGVAEAWATLLDEDTYLCSARTMHRVLAERGLTGERRQQPPRDHAAKPRVVATAPNQVWVWDISRLKGPSKGFWFYLYAIWDLWSRKIIGWTINTVETADIAHHLIDVTCGREGVDRFQLIIHSDRGAQMMSVTLTELYDQLGVRRSLSRPRVSNDNPQAEAGFKTLKYRADWPGSFATLADAVAHVEAFVDWYNHDHHHTGIGLVTPADRHAGRGQAIDLARQATLDAAYAKHPERFGYGRPTPPNQPDRVWINPPTITSK
ncbi:MAG: IS3 family transposase [Actinomycetota bacterium]|nr:IS3 family transposase [Actinomycetota bacterium]